MKSNIQIIEAKTDDYLLGKPSEEQNEYASAIGIRSISSGEVNILESEAGDNIFANLRKYSKTVYLRNLDNLQLILKREVPITIEFSDNVFTAISYDLEEFGIGNDEFEALKDLRESIVSLFYLFKEEEDNLGPLPRRQLEYLKDIIIEK